ncbi:hypothetical protein JVX90_02330 [Gordonia sp. PDNC005]|uniref:hypothetical protein n=1 Tax=unclassified Gordonia (in: high G+C Gram-positive bacteria) TaxID=2657482 RepID=UPI00196230BD|nr:hypothetical protein [Gordonia sp. PDNC005]QRY63102.1 hypothetical protein JVX90_02330 [Gordonia sp. PDNC005]
MISKLVSETVGKAVSVPGSTVRFVLSEALTFLTEEIDATQMLMDAIDLNRIVGTLDLNPIVEKLDINAVLDTVDLNRLIARLDINAVLDQVDLPKLLERIDLNALLADLDLDAVLARVDANAFLDGVDMSSVVRGASTTVTTEMISDVRTGSERADDVVEGIVNRMLGRKQGND